MQAGTGYGGNEQNENRENRLHAGILAGKNPSKIFLTSAVDSFHGR
jgi:hypothetical protein